MYNYGYQSHGRHNILIKFQKFKKNKIALEIKWCPELFQTHTRLHIVQSLHGQTLHRQAGINLNNRN